MAEKGDYEREIEREIEHDAAAHGGKRPKRKAGGSAKGAMGGRRMDRHARRQVGGVGVPAAVVGARPVATGAGLPLAAGTRALPVRPGVGGVAAGMPAAAPGAVMPTRVMPRAVGAAAPAIMGAAARPPGMKDGGHARRQVGGRDGGKYPERVTRPWGVENKHDLSRSSGFYEPESKVPRDDYDEGGHITAAGRRALPSSEFGLPGKAKTSDDKAESGNYPVDTPGRARAALSYSKRFASPSEQSEIRSRVKRKYPDMEVEG